MGNQLGTTLAAPGEGALTLARVDELRGVTELATHRQMHASSLLDRLYNDASHKVSLSFLFKKFSAQM